MSQRKAIYKTTPAFPEPNYTQTPNDFFDMLPDMEASEIIVTLIMIRNTFGFHRTNFKMGITKLMKATGLSRNAVKAGAEAAEDRGTFRRTNPDEQGESEWELVVGHSMTPLNQSPLGGQSVTGGESFIDPQSPIKESIKESLKIQEEEQPAANIFTIYENEIGMLTPMIADALQDAEKTYPAKWITDAIREAVKNNARNWKYIEAILKRWKAQGNQEPKQQPLKTFVNKASAKVAETTDALAKYAQENGLVIDV